MPSRRAAVAMKWVKAWLPAALWAATIFALSSIPGRALPELPLWNADKLVHAAVYAVLGALCWRGARSSFAPGTAPWRVVLIAVLLTSLYGIADEIHQMFVPNRAPDPNDVRRRRCRRLAWRARVRRDRGASGATASAERE